MTGNDFLLKDARELLAQADASEAVQAYYRDLPLGHIWQGNEPLKRAYLSESTSFGEALGKLQSQLFDHASVPRERELARDWFLRMHGSNMPPVVSEYVPQQKWYWTDDFRHRCTMQKMFNRGMYAVDTGRVIELGGGTGSLAFQMMCQRHPAIRQYVIIDLPDTLVYAHMFLRANFPDANFRFITESIGNTVAMSEQIGNATGKVDFIFCPVGMESQFYGEKFDLFVNTASMGEMPIATVKHWFDFVQNKIDCKYILSVNRFLSLLSPQNVSWRQSENTTAFQFDRRWKILDWELTPDFLRSPWANRHARQLLVIAERMAEEQSTDRDLVGDALCGSWSNPHRELSVQDHPLTCDFTMNGPLFMLWEAHRLGLPGAADGLKGYMQFLRVGRPDMVFEEELHL